MQMKLTVGVKGQVVIPKKIREAVGIKPEGEVLMEVIDKTVEIRAFSKEDLVKKWSERAKKNDSNVSKWVYGDKLYEEGF